MNFFYVYDGHWPHNATRVGKQVNVLTEAGHEVTILSRSRPGQARVERNGILRVVRLPAYRWRRLDRLVSYPVFLNPVWDRAIKREARRAAADAIIVRDLPLAPAAIRAGTQLGIPVHYDMAEVYPVALHTMLPHESSLAMRAVRASGIAERVERWVVHHATTTFVVSEESRQRCVGLGVPANRVVQVGNTPANPEALMADWPRPDDMRDLAGRPTALFVGNVFADRGLKYAIEAMAIVTRNLPSAVLVIVGDGRELPRLREQVASAKLENHVRFLGWKHHNDHPAYLRHAQVGILPFLATEHIRITLANKLFDYMAAGLPVVASDVPPMRRIIDRTASGVLVEAANAQDLGDALLRLFQNPDLAATLGQGGRAGIASEYAWANDARRFLSAVERERTSSLELTPAFAGARNGGR